ILENGRSESRWHIGRLQLIFDQNGNAVQAADRSGCFKGSIEPLGLLQCTRVDGLNRIQTRPRFVVGGDAFEVELDQFAARGSPGPKRGVDVADSGLHEMKGHDWLQATFCDHTGRVRRREDSDECASAAGIPGAYSDGGREYSNSLNFGRQ